ncbi:TPA: SAM-dependent DNA methyltransferase, partial [Listeria monocytogenes]|nr:SAM-dependent DNA methyltransferase [Listeria monocytogenes]
MTLTTETINNLIGIKESYQASDALMKILFDREKREEIFKQFLQHDTHLEKEWFHV